MIEYKHIEKKIQIISFDHIIGHDQIWKEKLVFKICNF